MIPGRAKSRKQLPWLPYPRNDQMYVINAHNFQQPTFNVNGKVPVAVWCPSRDDASVGTSTLRDLVGSNNGTLTDMDPATDWVADSTAGGIRALDFDGVNDFVTFSPSALANIPMSTGFAVAAWVKPSTIAGGDTFSTTNPRTIIRNGTNTTNDLNYIFRILGGQLDFTYRNAANTGFVGIRSVASVVVANVWQHVGAIHTGSTMHLYYNGLEIASTITGNASDNSINVPGRLVQIAQFIVTTLPRLFSGRIDDMRIFNQALDASDIAYLYNSGNGRGRVF